jgi:NADH-quinone oxidoreductase subunit H
VGDPTEVPGLVIFEQRLPDIDDIIKYSSEWIDSVTLSALRSAAQMVSYEVSIGFVLVTVVMCAGSQNLSEIVRAQDKRFGFLGWNWLPLLPLFIIFFVSAPAETNRPPFDLMEAESKLVAGYSVDYSASLFLLQYLTDLVAVLTMSAMTAVPFLGGWLSPLPFPPFTWVPGLIWFHIKAWSVVLGCVDEFD